MEETTTTLQTAPTLEIPATLKELVEALIFAAEEPLTAKQVKTIYEASAQEGEERRIEAAVIQEIIAELNEEFRNASKPYRIIQIAGGYQFATLPDYAGWLGILYKEQGRRKLSQSALECLAIIAYRQPISKPEIESIRGVNCDYVLKTLLEKDLATIVGRASTPGRPLLYGTTQSFLKHFGLNDVNDLPKPREIEELLGDSRYEAERRMMEVQQKAEAEKAKTAEEDFKSRLPHIPKKKPALDSDVEIVPKRRPRQLTLRETTNQETTPNQPVQTGEEQQTSIPLTDEIAVQPIDTLPAHDGIMSVEGSLDGETPVEPGPSHEALILPPIRPTVAEEQPKVEEPPLPVEEGIVESESSAERVQPIVEVPQETSEAEEEHIERTETILPSVELQAEEPHAPEDEPAKSGARTSRWQTWKEKIQGFIKRVFG